MVARQVLYGGLVNGKRTRGRSKVRYKDKPSVRNLSTSHDVGEKVLKAESRGEHQHHLREKRGSNLKLDNPS